MKIKIKVGFGCGKSTGSPTLTIKLRFVLCFYCTFRFALLTNKFYFSQGWAGPPSRAGPVIFLTCSCDRTFRVVCREGDNRPETRIHCQEIEGCEKEPHLLYFINNFLIFNIFT